VLFSYGPARVSKCCTFPTGVPVIDTLFAATTAMYDVTWRSRQSGSWCRCGGRSAATVSGLFNCRSVINPQFLITTCFSGFDMFILDDFSPDTSSTSTGFAYARSSTNENVSHTPVHCITADSQEC